MTFARRMSKVGTVFVCTWLASSVAFSRGSIAPELPLIEDARKGQEYPVLRRIQDLTMELQLLELTIKNKRDAVTEAKIATAQQGIEEDGLAIAKRFREMRERQLEGIAELLSLAAYHGRAVGISQVQWDELLAALQEGTIAAGNLTVLRASGSPLYVLSLTPLYMGRQVVWKLSLPPADRNSFWVQARSRMRAAGVRPVAALTIAALEKRIEQINDPYAGAETLVREYFTSAYQRLYGAFEDHRYAILQRITLARKALMELGRTATAMGTPEQYSTLYNQVLENLFSYGVDISLSGTQRDFEIRGFLFASSPEEATQLLKRLKYMPGVASYNSPSS